MRVEIKALKVAEMETTEQQNIIVLVTFDTNKNDSAIPGEATPSSTMAVVQLLFSSIVPRDLSAAISILSPPNMITNLSSLYTIGHCHWLCFNRAYSGWSAAMTGVCPGLRKATYLESSLWNETPKTFGYSC